MKLRPYQEQAITALNSYIATHEDNPCVVLPTASGKSFVMAEAIRRWKTSYPPFRAMILAHRKELVDQNSKELKGIYPEGDIGVYAASMDARDTESHIIFAAIDSVFNRAEEFDPPDVIVVDEAHRIPVRGEGKYRRFISDCKERNPYLRVIGFTATPFRLGSGPICHRDYILNSVCYEAKVADLVRDGYLCRLRSKVSTRDNAPDLSDVKTSIGEYRLNALGEAVRKDDLVHRAVEDALFHLDEERRKCCVWFCVDIAHCEDVMSELESRGERAISVTGKTSASARDEYVELFRNGKVRHLLNVNVFTEGFNVKQVDAVVLLRPTLSRSLYIQMVGRGLRLHPSKSDCIVLDYAHCIETHGPIDSEDEGRVALETCGACREVFARGLRKCPRCGWEIPKQVIEERERAERERRLHEERAAQLAILGSTPQRYPVSAVMVSRHSKNGIDSLCVTYRCGVQTFREWICLDHEGYARQKACAWWSARFPGCGEAPSVDQALSDIFLGNRIFDKTKSVTVVKDGKYDKILSYELKDD